jgi:hypothetical protein
VIKKNIQCLMIQTNDNRKFCTDMKGYNQLIEFANTFEAEISIIDLEEGDLLTLEEVATAISDPRYNQIPKYKLIERKVGKKRIVRKNMFASREIKEYARNLLSGGNTLCFKELMGKFKNSNLSYNAFAAHMHKLRREFEAKGHFLQKIGPGQYRVISKAQLTEAV